LLARRLALVPPRGAARSADPFQIPLCEGEVVGETSCLDRTPRPATVIFTRECLVVEILRTILEQMQQEPTFRDSTDELHRRRAPAQWRRLSLFAELSDEQYQSAYGELQALRVKPGAVICDEHERGEALYVIANGLVREARNVSALLSEDSIRDWQRLWAPSEEGALQEGMAGLWRLLDEQLWADQHIIAIDDLQNLKERSALLHAWNRVLGSPGLLDEPELGALLASPLVRKHLGDALRKRDDLRRRGKDWPDQEARRCHRLLLEVLLPGAVRPLAEQGALDTTIAYHRPGEWFGEKPLLSGAPHETTCSACGHPKDEGFLELVRIPARTFTRLMAESAVLRERVLREAERRQDIGKARMALPLWRDPVPAQVSRDFQERGLPQGQQLMLIDLDRCTRCDDCVKACADGHGGVARLVLDGPRLGKFLLPTTCRSCRDPVCLIGCPVGSIHRGAGGEIVIEDWCIGCGLCAEHCPYGAIQMQDIGVLPERWAWRFQPGEAVTNKRWMERDFRDSDWLTGEGPFHFDRDLAEQLAERRPRRVKGAGEVLFRCTFPLSPAPESACFRLEVASRSPAIEVWVNGEQVEAEGKPRQGLSTYVLPAQGPRPPLRGGTNAIALRVGVPGEVPRGELLLSARLDEVRRPRLLSDGERELDEAVVEKLVTHRAAVCDLCDGLPGAEPLCIRACAHEAAVRIDALSDFPACG
jgi:Fe-S-cluster-containing hydrogenase component 2/CRP-like cAMP-binding protein